MTRQTQINVRLSSQERDQLRSAAGDRTISEWAREVLVREAARACPRCQGRGWTE